MRNIADTEPVVKLDDPDELEARGDELIAEGHTLRAKAHRLRRVVKLPGADPWVTMVQFEAETGFKRGRIIDGGKRGELRLHKLGDAVVVRRSELDRWIEAHPVTAKVVLEPDESDEKMYAKLAGAK
jgi:hypothetical protein